jgi:hypothetical protein
VVDRLDIQPGDTLASAARLAPGGTLLAVFDEP